MRKDGFWEAIIDSFSIVWDSASAAPIASRSYLLKGIAILLSFLLLSNPDHPVLFSVVSFVFFLLAVLAAFFFIQSFPCVGIAVGNYGLIEMIGPLRCNVFSSVKGFQSLNALGTEVCFLFLMKPSTEAQALFSKV